MNIERSDCYEIIKSWDQKRITDIETNGYSFEYDIKINGHKLDRGVTDIKLDMNATDKPRLTINCVPDVLDIDVEALLDALKFNDQN